MHVTGLLGGPLPVSAFSGPQAPRNTSAQQEDLSRSVAFSFQSLLLMEEEKRLKNSEVFVSLFLTFATDGTRLILKNTARKHIKCNSLHLFASPSKLPPSGPRGGTASSSGEVPRTASSSAVLVARWLSQLVH